MSFCVAGVALCDIPTCLRTCRKCQNWRKSRTKCSFWCSHVSRLEALVFLRRSPCLWGKLENISYSNVAKQVVMSFCMAGVALCDIPTCLRTCRKCQNWRKSRTKCSFFLQPRVSSRVSGFPVASPWSMGEAPRSTLYTPHSTLYAPHSTLLTPHFTFHTPHFTLLTLHSTLYTPHSTLYTLGWWSRDSCGASCHVLLTWLRAISVLLSVKILINIQRCRCPKRSIEFVSMVA